MVLARACATVDERDERIALEYLERIVGARIERRPLVELIGDQTLVPQSHPSDEGRSR